MNIFLARDGEAWGSGSSSGSGSTNKGFNEKKAMESLENINTNYKQMMGAVSDYQNNGIEVLCNNWQSNKGKEKIEQLVTQLNSILEKTTANFSAIFDFVNKKAEAIDRDSDGINYEAVAFEPQEDSFSAANAKNDTEAGSIAQWDLTETNKGVDNIKRFIENRVRKNMDEIEIEMYMLEAAFEYSEDGAAVSNAIHQVTSKVEEFAVKVSKGLDGWEEEYKTDAAAHNVNLEELTSGTNGIELDLDF